MGKGSAPRACLTREEMGVLPVVELAQSRPDGHVGRQPVVVPSLKEAEEHVRKGGTVGS